MIRWLILLLLIPSLCFSDSENTIGGHTASPHLIEYNGAILTPTPYLNFTGPGVSCSNINGITTCYFAGGSSPTQYYLAYRGVTMTYRGVSMTYLGR